MKNCLNKNLVHPKFQNEPLQNLKQQNRIKLVHRRGNMFQCRMFKRDADVVRHSHYTGSSIRKPQSLQSCAVSAGRHQARTDALNLKRRQTAPSERNTAVEPTLRSI